MGTGSYFDKALSATTSELIYSMRRELRGVEYDTIVGTGLSGTIFAARVAAGMGKKFAIVRKADDRSTHSGAQIEGRVGKRWVFVDDFVSSGRTMKRVLEKMMEHRPDCKFAGTYEYEGPRFSAPRDGASRWGEWVVTLSLGPLCGPQTRQDMEAKYPWGTAELKAPVDGWDDRVLPFVPLPSWRYITLEYPGADGVPRFYDSLNGITIKGTDPRAASLVARVEAYQRSGGDLYRVYGLRMDKFPAAVAQVRVPTRFTRSGLDSPC